MMPKGLQAPSTKSMQPRFFPQSASWNALRPNPLFQCSYTHTRRDAGDVHMHISGIPSELYRSLGSAFCLVSLFRRERNSLKKAVNNFAHSSSNTPPVTPGAWLYGNAKRFTTEPQEPAFWSFAPNTTRGIRALIIAPAHIGQGSNVTYSVHCHRRQPPNARQAPSIASNSAWQSAFFPTSRRFRPRAITRS